MNQIHRLLDHVNLLAIPGSLIAGIATYFVMYIFFIPISKIIPEAILIAILVFGLTKYYTKPKAIESRDIDNRYAMDVDNNILIGDIFFVGIYVSFLIIVIFFARSNLELFIPWKEFSLLNALQLGAAVGLCFFVPGYAIISAVDREHKLRPLLRGLLAYILSMFFSGFAGYILASLAFPISDMRALLIVIYALALLPFIVVLFSRLITIRKKNKDWSFGQSVKKQVSLFRRNICVHYLFLLIFGSLLTQIILSTYILYGGVIIGDQWFHHGRSLTLFYGSYSHYVASGVEEIYPPFLSALLGVFVTICGNVPSINAYASIGFLNIIPVLSFYYFFTSWISAPRLQKAAIIASAFFMFSAGFGWVYALDIAMNHPLTSPLSALQALYTASKQTFDIRTPSTFVLASHPDFSTGIQLIVLPIGFVLLGILKEVTKARQRMFCVIVFVISTLAILSHDEIYLFFIIASIISLAYRLPHNSFLYAGLLCSILFTVLLDAVFPGSYSAYEFFGLPLQVLIILFVGVMWLLYKSNIFSRALSTVVNYYMPKKVLTTRGRFILGMALAIAATFLYIFSYMVWGRLSFEEIQLHIATNNVPWYIYPFKMGIMGILGSAFVISFVFRKFEKEVFIFVIISLIALLLGPYYDEHRFSKYVMVGLAGLGSLLIYEFILFLNRIRFKSLFTGIVIGSVIVLTSFSTLFYLGYHALALETDRLDLALGRRDFPSLSELDVFSFLQRHESANNNTGTSNVITFANEYQKQHGLMGKLQGFSGIPIPLLLKQPLTLNASTLEGLYSHLGSGDNRYILLPKNDIHLNREQGNVLKFVYNHFQKSYEDDNFIILSVPTKLAAPSSLGEIAMLYDSNGFLSSSAISGSKINLPFKSMLFGNLNNSKFVKFEKSNQNIILNGTKKSNTLWSNPIEFQNKTQTINYIESTFRIFDENKTKIHNDCGVTWDNGKKKYYTYLRDDKLGFTETPVPEKRFALENKELKWQKWKWYTFKIVFQKDSANMYVDNLLKLQIPATIIGDSPIIRVGFRCSGSVAEIEPIKLGTNPMISNDSLQEKYDLFHHFYPLNTLALSDLSYDTFLDNDLSAYSKKYVLLTHDPSSQEDIKKYLEIVKRGGTVIVLNTNDTTEGGEFSKLLLLKHGNSSRFDSIALAANDDEAKPYRLNIPGLAREIFINSTSEDESVVSSYLRNNQSIAPFAIEKKYDTSGGKIIYINIAGYFDALYQSPKKYFLSLGNISKLVNIETAQSSREQRYPEMVSEARFTGNLTASGHAVINTSSLLFLDNSNNTQAEKISISSEDKKSDLKSVVKVINKNVPLRDIKLYGQYKAIITSDGITRLPSPYSASSEFDYIAISIPNGSNITLEPSDGAGIELASGNQTRKYSLVDNERFKFQNLKTNDPEVDSVLVLVKKPELSVVGNLSFEDIYRNLGTFYSTKNVLGLPLKLSNTKLKAAINQIDNYQVAGKSGTKTSFVTFLKSLDIDENRSNKIDLRIPGDISDRAKAEGMVIPWEKVIISYSSITAFSILSIGALLTFLLWKRLSAGSGPA